MTVESSAKRTLTETVRRPRRQLADSEMLTTGRSERILQPIEVRLDVPRSASPVFSIVSGELLAGELPTGKARLVQAWIEIHGDELQAAWKLAVNGEEVFKIDPLR